MRRLAPLWLLVLAAGPSQASQHGRVLRIEKPPQTQVYVPAGAFAMGVSGDDENDEIDTAVTHCKQDFPSPQFANTNGETSFCDEYRTDLERMVRRTVTVQAFFIDREEVSVARYRRCVAAGGCNLEPLVAGDQRYIHDDWPMVNITWSEAQAFCRWEGGGLPTEAQWERAARGDDRRPWPWGDVERDADFNHGKPSSTAMREIDQHPYVLVGSQPTPAGYLGDPDDTDGAALIAPPGSYTWGEGPFGTRDQAGNVAEWTADLWVSSDVAKGYANLNMKTGMWTTMSSIDPVREGSTTDPHVVRGGSWRQPAWLGHANLRDPFNTEYVGDHRFSHIGFRCARSAR